VTAIFQRAARSAPAGRALALSLAVLVAGGVIAAAYGLFRVPVRRFGVVEKGVLYRSGQPDAGGWRWLRDRCGIRTVINLRGEYPSQPWAILEKKFCRDNGIRYIALPIGPDRLSDEQLRLILRTISDPASQPVLVHCELGKSRTGVVVAAYRIVAQGWSYEAALAESRKFKRNMNAGYAAYLRELSGRRGRCWLDARAVGLAGP